MSKFDLATQHQDELMPVLGDVRPQNRNVGGATTNAPSSSAPQQLLLHNNGHEVNSSLIDAILDTDSFLVSRLLV